MAQMKKNPGIQIIYKLGGLSSWMRPHGGNVFFPLLTFRLKGYCYLKHTPVLPQQINLLLLNYFAKKYWRFYSFV